MVPNHNLDLRLLSRKGRKPPPAARGESVLLAPPPLIRAAARCPNLLEGACNGDAGKREPNLGMGMCTKESITQGVLSTHHRSRCSSAVGVCGISSGSVARQVRSRCTLTREHKNIVPGTREITLLAFAMMLFLRIPMMFTFTLWTDKIILIRNFRKPAIVREEMRHSVQLPTTTFF